MAIVPQQDLASHEQRGPVEKPFSYVGSKGRVADWVIRHLPRSGVRRYVETCVGSGAILCALPTRYPEEVIVDLDGGVTAFWRALRDRPEELIEAALATPYSRPEWLAARDRIRADGYPDDDLEAARLFICLCQMSFGRINRPNSGWRVHAPATRTGWVAGEWARLPDRWPEVAKRLHGVCVDEGDIRAVVRRHDAPGTLFYCDPPYHPETAEVRQCYRLWLTRDDHAELAEVLTGAAGMVVLSGYRCPDYDEWFAGWRRVDLEHKTHLGTMRNIDSDTRRVESLWLNPAADAALGLGGLFGGHGDV